MNPPESVISYTHDSTGITLEAWVCHKTNIAYVSLGDNKSFYEYMIEDIHSGYTTHRGKECMDGILDAIRIQHPAIRTVEIYENTYLYGMMPNKETMDLSTYSVALYGKTWYEMNWNIVIDEGYREYRSQVEHYASVETKVAMTWFDMMFQMYMGAPYTREILEQHRVFFEEAFHSTSTLPDFFIKISNVITPDKRIGFFQHWLYNFVHSYIKNDNNLWSITI
jgi:hypothetical protein